ncbi:ABC transporter ATP-binding protein [Variovorax sp. LjRoot290]|uniref:ABC transporter ATP-binding protein n=1 Tax=Variovorax sp. LjRoot290 TaxID=3342316 RepID=UPI003ED03080
MVERRIALSAKNLNAFYGDSHVLHGIDFEIREGEVVTLLGRNGAGRSTTLKAILGLTGRRTGSIVCRGRELVGMPSHEVARLGIGYCPEERGIFSSLSCEENLMLLPTVAPGGMSLDDIYKMFPNLHERRRSPGTRLSGGEQQMLALARILRTGATLLLLDEISEGLAPVIVQALGRAISALRTRGYTIVLVEQNLQFVSSLADRHLLVEHGRIVADIAAADLDRHADTFRQVLGV